MTVKELIYTLSYINRPDDIVYVTYDADNACSQVDEVYITMSNDCCRGMVGRNKVALRCL